MTVATLAKTINLLSPKDQAKLFEKLEQSTRRLPPRENRRGPFREVVQKTGSLGGA